MPKLTAAQRRALEALASWPDGCPEATMIVQGFEFDNVRGLVDAGLATAEAVCTFVAGDRVEVTHVRITDAGRAAL